MLKSPITEAIRQDYNKTECMISAANKPLRCSVEACFKPDNIQQYKSTIKNTNFQSLLANTLSMSE